ncbi:yeats-domain-containing protein [Piedraia hortae CBS 480.64]|uniref:Protein AF-9 homolog n=1 Tax=Piedraia hortae CBS 480.64 TaxID=1314780 RepID=A0A6A7BRU2_9PEZI|nr:yeats-domain-containing protein [Piedraia hortae CBS 480.64]
MPAPSKRVKGVQVRRHFLIGNEAFPLPHEGFPDPAPEGHTKGWRVYVRPLPNGPDITTWLKKVQFKLHHTFADASRTVEAPGPFEVTETGYGEFAIEIRLFFATESGEKALYREHYLCLQAATGTGPAISERMETVEFNEPAQDFLKKLTSEEQFDWLKTKKGRGKGKKAEMVFEGQCEPSAQLPDRAPPGPTGIEWSTRFERQILEGLKSSAKRLDEAIEEEQQFAKEREKELASLAEKLEAARARG